VVGAVTAFLRPDDRWLVHFDAASRDDSCRPLLVAVAGNTASDLFTTIEEADGQALELFGRLSFTVSRREGNYLIPVDLTSPCEVLPGRPSLGRRPGG